MTKSRRCPMTQEKKAREKHAHQLILAKLREVSEMLGFMGIGIENTLLEILEEMKISETHFREIADELERLKNEFDFGENQKTRIDAMIAEFRQ